MKTKFLLLLLIVWANALLAQPGERILSFDSDITVHPNTAMTVRETIRVNVLGQQIRRGIYRDFPTDYRDKLGNRIQIGFDVESVRRDGAPEKFRVERLANGRRVRIGEAETLLKNGVHVYTIVYRTTRQLGFFEKHDELYWNVTGTGWKFPIDEVSATVRLPDSVVPATIEMDGYTGPQGAVGTMFEATLDSEEPSATFVTTEGLGAGEGLTVVVGWPKGHVTPPGPATRIGYFIQDNAATSRVLAGLTVVTVYFLVAWILIGRDPQKGTIIPRFYPPKGLSPAACRFVYKMGFDNTCFAAAIISLAVKRVLKIKEYENGVVSLQKLHPTEIEVSPGEASLYETMMPYEESMALTQSNHHPIKRGTEALQESLEDEFETHYFFKNIGWFVPGAALALLFVIYGFFPLMQNNGTGVIAIIAMVVGAAVLSGIYKLARRSITWQRLVGSMIGGVLLAGFIILFYGLRPSIGSGVVPVAFLATVLAIVLVCLLFYELLKRPTIHGRRTMDEVDGFRMYLETAEVDRLAAMHPPERTPELFEKYLPYALALGVEQEWAESFAQMLIAAANNPMGESTYEPVWYHSYGGQHSGAFNPLVLTSSISSSLTTSIASASTPPGSSSGFGGSSGGFSSGGFGGGGFSGGFSGGGGGGGGGGGW